MKQPSSAITPAVLGIAAVLCHGCTSSGPPELELIPTESCGDGCWGATASDIDCTDGYVWPLYVLLDTAGYTNDLAVVITLDGDWEIVTSAEVVFWNYDGTNGTAIATSEVTIGLTGHGRLAEFDWTLDGVSRVDVRVQATCALLEFALAIETPPI